MDADRVTGAAKEAVGKVQGSLGDIAGSRRDSAEGRLREVEGGAENLWGRTKDAARHAADAVSDFADDPDGVYDGYASEGVRAVRSRVEDAPLASLLIAGLVGYGLALLVHGRR